MPIPRTTTNDFIINDKDQYTTDDTMNESNIIDYTEDGEPIVIYEPPDDNEQFIIITNFDDEFCI